jgi:hypothetical protein
MRDRIHFRARLSALALGTGATPRIRFIRFDLSF